MSEQNGSVPSPLRVAVLGAGNIGSAFAFQLARVGRHQVTAIARPGSLRLEQLRRDGSVVNTAGERAEVQVADHLDEQQAYDLVVVTLLAHQVEAVLPALQRSAAKSILLMFNNFEPETLRDALGAARCSFGMPFVQARLNPAGRLTVRIGAAGQKSKMDSGQWASVFEAAGLPAVVEPRMLLWLRCHVPLAAAFESVSVAAMRRGGGASWKQAMEIARGAQAGFTVIKRMGYPVYPAGKAFFHAAPAAVLAGTLGTLSRARSFRELLATGEAECCALVDTLLEHAGSQGDRLAVRRIAAMRPQPKETS